VSVKTPRVDTFILLHLRPPFDHTLSENEILEYDFDGKLVAGRRDPPEEIFFYTCLYKAKRTLARSFTAIRRLQFR